MLKSLALREIHPNVSEWESPRLPSINHLFVEIIAILNPEYHNGSRPLIFQSVIIYYFSFFLLLRRIALDFWVSFSARSLIVLNENSSSFFSRSLASLRWWFFLFQVIQPLHQKSKLFIFIFLFNIIYIHMPVENTTSVILEDEMLILCLLHTTWRSIIHIQIQLICRCFITCQESFIFHICVFLRCKYTKCNVLLESINTFNILGCWKYER